MFIIANQWHIMLNAYRCNPQVIFRYWFAFLLKSQADLCINSGGAFFYCQDYSPVNKLLMSGEVCSACFEFKAPNINSPATITGR